MLKIRLQRIGRRNLALYRLVVAEHTAPIKGKFQEKLGNYNPHTHRLDFNREGILFWLNHGAKISNSAARILTKAGLTDKRIKFVPASPKPKKIKKKALEKPKMPKLETENQENEINQAEVNPENSAQENAQASNPPIEDKSETESE